MLKNVGAGRERYALVKLFTRVSAFFFLKNCRVESDWPEVGSGVGFASSLNLSRAPPVRLNFLLSCSDA